MLSSFPSAFILKRRAVNSNYKQDNKSKREQQKAYPWKLNGPWGIQFDEFKGTASFAFAHIYKHTYKFPLASASGDKNLILLSRSEFFKNDGNAKPDMLLLRPWDLIV